MVTAGRLVGDVRHVVGVAKKSPDYAVEVFPNETKSPDHQQNHSRSYDSYKIEREITEISVSFLKERKQLCYRRSESESSWHQQTVDSFSFLSRPPPPAFLLPYSAAFRPHAPSI